MADYTLDTNDVAPWCSYVSSDTAVATIASGGLLTAVGPGTATITATYLGNTLSNTVTVLPMPAPGTLVTFGNPNTSGQYLAGTIPATYQPVPGLTLGWVNAGATFDGGPDHNWGAFQRPWDGLMTTPQEYDFSQAVSLPSLRLTTRAGAGDVVTINAYGASGLLGTETVPTPVHAGPGSFKWVQCTNFDQAKYNGQITMLEISSPGNAEVDDMLVVPDWGALTALYLQLAPTNPATFDSTSLVPGMSRQAKVLADYALRSGVDVTTGASFSSGNTSVATVSSSGVVQPVSPGTATITASLGGFAQSVDVVVTALPDGATLVNFNDGLPGNLSYNPLPAYYEPVTNLVMGYVNIELNNSYYTTTYNGGFDHTTTSIAYGVNHYFIITTTPQLANATGVFTFNRPVAISSVYLTTGQGGSATNKSTNVTVRAFADVAGTSLLYSNTVPTPLPTWSWIKFTDLASLGTNIMRVEFSSTGVAVLDDMTLIAPPLGDFVGLHLQLPPTNWVPNLSVPATVLADYANVTNVIVTVGCGTTYSSSDTNILTINASGVVKAINPGTAILSATLSNVTSTVEVTVTQLPVQYAVSGTNLTFSWPTYATTNYILQSSAVVGPGAVWTTVTNARTTVGSNYQIPVPINPATPAAYFRLRLVR